MPKFKPGLSFGDYLVKDSARGKVRPLESQVMLGGRLYRWLGAAVVVAMGLLLARLVSLQLIEGSRLRVLANENRIQQIKLVAPRGKIWDRNGQVLADNRQILKVHPPLQLTVEGWERRYPLGAASAQVVGYLGEVALDEVGLLGEGQDKYAVGDMIGRGGTELQYERQLRGKDGGRLVEVDSLGKVAREIGRRPPTAGHDLHLTLDASLQEGAFVALAGKKGAVVATNPKTGEVLVLASSPGLDPLNIGDSLHKDDQPFLNRAVGGAYAPGSTFKMVSVVAALAEGKLPTTFTYTDTGAITIGSFAYTNWYFTQYGRTEGETGWVKGLTRSVDTFFYKVGEHTGPQLLAKWANNLGLGALTRIDLPGEVTGLIPTPGWKQRAKGEQWFLGNTYHMAIGQGDVLVTPLQLNLMTGALAAGGLKCRPHLNADLKSQCDQLHISSEILDIIKKGMIGACSAGGTAFPLFDFASLPGGRQVACKTGTAEYVRSDGKIGTHAWLTAFAPADDPTIAVTALVEGGGEGSRAAAPIVRKVLAKYFGVEDHYNYTAISGVGE